MNTERDIVERLRVYAGLDYPLKLAAQHVAFSEAAAEIVALRDALARRDAEIAAWVEQHKIGEYHQTVRDVLGIIAFDIEAGAYRKDDA